MPGTDGKRYAGAASVAQLPLPLNEDETDDKRCKHGLIRRYCTICNPPHTSERRRRKVRQRTVDVFELLKAYLQPPIEQRLRNLVLFPSDRKPYPFQVDGIRFLLEHPRALLADDMGLGKTVQAIVALQALFCKGKCREALVLCPRSLLGNWERELKKWAPFLYVVKVRGTHEDRKDLWRVPAAVRVTTYDTLRQDVKIVPRGRLQVVILDEIQSIKNPDAKRTRAVRTLDAEYRWGLSGTPLENRIEDIVSIFDYLQPGLFPAEIDPSLLSVAQVREAIRPYMLRRRLVDVVTDLPQKVSNEVWLDLTDEQRETYDRMEAEGRAGLSRPDATRVHVFTLINALKQICNRDSASGESCKVDYLVDRLEIVAEAGQKALVFSQFPTKTLTQIRHKLEPYGPVQFDGSLTDRQREDVLAMFKNDPKHHVMLASVKAGGVGLNITEANHVFHFDHWWNPATARQAEGRVHRIGQKLPVFVHSMYTNDTIEERIYYLLQRKKALFASVVDELATGDVSKHLTDEDLFGLFDLAPPGASPTVAGHDFKALRAAFLANPHNITPREFEELVGDIYRQRGFTVHPTQYTADGGVDLVAIRKQGVHLQRLLIQCKHWPDRTVGEPPVRDLLGAVAADPDATGGVMVTSGRYSQPAIRFARSDSRIELEERASLEQSLRQPQR